MNILEVLKAETELIHQSVEQVSLLKKIITHEITLQEYKKLLVIFYGFINPCEKKIQATFPSLLIAREKSSLLCADLSVLQELAPNLTTFCDSLPVMTTEAETYGYLYVMEGATLGGQVITQALNNNPHLPENMTTLYFNPYGKDTRSKWGNFSAELSQKYVTAAQYQQVISGAVATFTALLYWLQRNIQNECST
jgi:heme oxygenase